MTPEWDEALEAWCEQRGFDRCSSLARRMWEAEQDEDAGLSAYIELDVVVAEHPDDPF